MTNIFYWRLRITKWAVVFFLLLVRFISLSVVFANNEGYDEQSLLELTSFNGGEELQTGQTYAITWEQKNIDKVTLAYSLGEGSLDWIERDFKVDSDSLSGSYSWKIPEAYYGKHKRRKMKIIITGYTTGGVYKEDASDNFFTVLPIGPILEIISPKDNEVINKNDDYTFTWDQKDIFYITIRLVGGGANNVNVVDRLPVDPMSSTGNYTWHVPIDLCTQIDKFKIVVFGYTADNDKVAVQDQSEHFISIIPQTYPYIQGSIHVISPNGGEELVAGNRYTISWDQSNLVAVRLAYFEFRENTNPKNVMYNSKFITTDEIPTDYRAVKGTYEWEIPDDISDGKYQLYIAGRGASCSFKDTRWMYSVIRDFSDNYFHVKSFQSMTSASIQNTNIQKTGTQSVPSAVKDSQSVLVDELPSPQPTPTPVPVPTLEFPVYEYQSSPSTGWQRQYTLPQGSSYPKMTIFAQKGDDGQCKIKGAPEGSYDFQYLSALINNRGQIAMGRIVGNGSKWKIISNLPGGEGVYVKSINDKGQAVGNARPTREEDGNSHAFLWSNGKIKDLGAVWGKYSESTAVDINNKGRVVGYYRDADGYHAVLWQNGKIIKLGSLGRNDSLVIPVAINDLGQIVGDVEDENGQQKLFMWENGKMKELTVFPNTGKTYFYTVVDINNKGQIIGNYSVSDSKTGKGHSGVFLWENGEMRDLGMEDVMIIDINNKGEIVGSKYKAGWGYYGFILKNGEVIPINDFLPDSEIAKHYFDKGLNINDRGQILGEGVILKLTDNILSSLKKKPIEDIANSASENVGDKIIDTALVQTTPVNTQK